MGKHVFESAGEATRVNKVNEHGAASHASDYALPRAATRQAETLHRATGGRLSRASHVFLQMQRQFGNRHVNRVIRHAQSITVQPKLTLGEASTPHELEADKIAHKVARGGQLTTAPTPVHGSAMAIAPETESAIKHARGGGRPLDSRSRAAMERSFGADLSGVRLHTDDRAHALNEDLNAKAFTTGQDIFFRRGTYSEGSSEAKHLLSHEITHTLQQRPQAASGLIQRTRWEWNGKEWKTGDKNAVGPPDIHDGTFVGDKYNDENRRYVYAQEPPDGGRRERFVQSLSQQNHAKDIMKKRDAAAENLSKHTKLQALYDDLVANGYNYSTVPEEYIEATDEFKAFKKLVWGPARDPAILASRLAMRRIEEKGEFDMAAEGEALFAEAVSRRDTADATSKLVRSLKWMPGPDMLSDFSKWLFEDASEPRKSATMNCWEAVLLGAFKAKAISKDDILKVYQSVLDVNVQVKEFKGQKDELEKQPFKNSDEWREKQKEISAISDAIAQLDQLWPTLIEKFLVQPPRYEFDPDDPNSTRPVQGDIIFLDSMSSHVALALGNTEGSPQMLSLWNQPDNNDFLQKISVSDLIGAGPPPFRSRVYFYRPGWQ